MTRTTAAPRAAAAPAAALQRLEPVPVQPDGGFVQRQHGRLPGQHGGQGKQPLLRGGQLRGVRVDGVGQPDGGQRFRCPRRGTLAAPQLPESEAHFPQDGPFKELVPRVLEQQADLRGQRPGRDAGDAAPADPDFSGSRPQQAVEATQQGRFARTVRTGDGHGLPRAHHEVKPGQELRPVLGRGGRIAEGKAPDVQQRDVRRPPPAARRPGPAGQLPRAPPRRPPSRPAAARLPRRRGSRRPLPCRRRARTQ